MNCSWKNLIQKQWKVPRFDTIRTRNRCTQVSCIANDRAGPKLAVQAIQAPKWTRTSLPGFNLQAYICPLYICCDQVFYVGKIAKDLDLAIGRTEPPTGPSVVVRPARPSPTPGWQGIGADTDSASWRLNLQISCATKFGTKFSSISYPQMCKLCFGCFPPTGKEKKQTYNKNWSCSKLQM